MKNKISFIALVMSVILITSCGRGKVEETKPSETIGEKISVATEYGEVPSLVGLMFSSELQQKLSEEGFSLSIKTEYHDTAPEGQIISQSPAPGTKRDTDKAELTLGISAGKPSQSIRENSVTENNAPTEEKPNPQGTGLSYPVWVNEPTFDFDLLETFGKSAYSIVKKWDNYGIVDINCRAYGTGAYTKLSYCPEHGLSSPDVKEEVILSDDLKIVPDCGYTTLESEKNIYVYDDSRETVYLTGYSNGVFRIAEITDTEFFRTNPNYIAVLYNCDADLMMYLDSGLESLEEIFAAENREMLYGVVNNELVTVIDFRYSEIRDGNDCYIVKQNGRYGYRGFSGQYYYDCIFEEANSAYNGAAWVKHGGKWGTVAF